MRKIIIGTALMACAIAGKSQTNSASVPCSAITVGPLGALNGFIPSPNDLWHQKIGASPADANSTNIINNIGANHLHHDWSSDGAGIPYTVVDSSLTPSVQWASTLYTEDSDNAVYPLTAATLIESSPISCRPPTGEDNHVIVVDKNKCVVHELWQGHFCATSTPAWTASNGNMWDMTISEQRPYGMTSVDAAGLSVFEGLVRYDEIVAGVIPHAIRFTTSMTRCDHYQNGDGVGAFVPPATHAACNNGGTLNIMGMRIRLKANFDISKYSAANQVILTAMKNYGMILADNGSSLFFQGTPDPRWNNDDLSNLDAVPNTAFEVVQMPTVLSATNAPTGASPVVKSFTASSTSIAPGDSVTLSYNATNASYAFIDAVGLVRGPVTVNPLVTTTYTLTTRNSFGTTTATVTVAVKSNIPKLLFSLIPTQTYGVAPFSISALSPSTGGITYSVLNGPATVSAKTVTVTGAGTVTLQASQAATQIYGAATTQMTFVVNPATPTLAMTPIPSKTYGAAPFMVSSTSNSPGGNTYSIASGPATISGNMLTLTGAGVVTVKVSQAATANYAAATATTSFTVDAGASVSFTLYPFPGNMYAYLVTVSPSSAVVTAKSITIFDGTTNMGNALMQVTPTTYYGMLVNLRPGQNNLTAVYSGDATHSAMTSAPAVVNLTY
jgi:hypothetical protein